MKATAKVVNTSKRVVLDGGGLVTLSGGGERRILYKNTCDPDADLDDLALRQPGDARGSSSRTSPSPRQLHRPAVRRRRRRRDLRARRPAEDRRLAVRPQPLRPARSRPRRRRRARAVAVPRPAGLRHRQHASAGGVCSNGGALSSIGVSWAVYNSTFTDNRAVGHGANPARAGTRGGGSGGAIYTDGNRFRLLRRRHDDDRQPRPRGRRRDLLRQQRPQRDPGDPLVDAAAQPQRRVRDRARASSSSVPARSCRHSIVR